MTLVIDPELRDHLECVPDTVDAELERQLIEGGGPLDPITIWKEANTIIDGHRRYRFCTKHNLPFRTREMSFPDKQSVMDWMDSYQGCRRNLTPHNFAALLGRMVSAAQRRGKNVRQAVAEVAAHSGVSTRTVYRAKGFADALDMLPDDIRKRIHDKEIPASQRDVIDLADLDEMHQRAVINQLDKGEFDSLSAALHGVDDVDEPEDFLDGPTLDESESQAPVSAKPVGDSVSPRDKRVSKPTGKPPTQVIQECISTLGAFARALDQTKKLDVAKYKSLRGYVDDLSSELDHWAKAYAPGKEVA
jgi:hypothetical protein